MSQPTSNFDLARGLSETLDQLHQEALAALSNLSGTGDPASEYRLPYGFLADSTARLFRQYPDVPDDGARPLWTLESGPLALIPVVATGNYTIPDGVGGGAAFRTLVLCDATSGSPVITLPDSANTSNAVVWILLRSLSGSNTATVQIAGSDAIVAPSGAAEVSSALLRQVGDLLGLYTVGDGKWRVFHDGIAGIRSLTDTTALSPFDKVALCSCSGGAWTLTLPAASSVAGRELKVVKTDGTGNALTVDVASSGTINGAASENLAGQYTSRRYLSADGTAFYKV